MTRAERKKKHLIVSALILVSVSLLLGLLVKGLTLDPTRVASTLVGKPAFPFSAQTLQGEAFLTGGDGKTISLDNFKGRPVVLNFWASWCVSCREEAAEFEQFWQRNRDKGVLVVGIAIQDTPEAALEFAKRFGKTYALGLDVSGKAAIDYGVYGVPETFLIDRNGVIQHKETGPMSVALLESKLPLITGAVQ